MLYAQPPFLFVLRWKALVTSPCLALFVSRGRRWWTRFSTQSASPTVWKSSLWRTQDSNRRFPLSSRLSWFNPVYSPFVLLAPSPLRHSSTSPPLTSPLPPVFSALSLSPWLASSLLTSIHFVSPRHLSSSPSPPQLPWPLQFCLFFPFLSTWPFLTSSSLSDNAPTWVFSVFCVCVGGGGIISLPKPEWDVGLHLTVLFTLYKKNKQSSVLLLMEMDWLPQERWFIQHDEVAQFYVLSVLNPFQERGQFLLVAFHERCSKSRLLRCLNIIPMPLIRWSLGIKGAPYAWLTETQFMIWDNRCKRNL